MKLKSKIAEHTEKEFIEKRRKYYREYYSKNKKKLSEVRKEYHRKHRDLYIGYSRKDHDMKQFGGKRQIVLERDRFQCQDCGMTQEQHIVLFSRGLTIDHIDNKGRKSEIKNNNLDNLRTLCLRCHGRKDVMQRRDIKERIKQLETEDGETK